MVKEKVDYLSYLLCLWREGEEKTAWRMSLESSRTGERKGFASLDDLVHFLRRQIGTTLGVKQEGRSALPRLWQAVPSVRKVRSPR